MNPRATSELPAPGTVPDDVAMIALGSNQGNSRARVLAAMDRLQALSRTPLVRSSLRETEPVDCPPGSPPFVNAVVSLVPLVATPGELLLQLQDLEREFGRLPKQIPNEPRPLDLDLLGWGSRTCRTGTLIVPHPRLHRRRFVLEPLVDVAPHWVIPGLGRTASECLAELDRGL